MSLTVKPLSDALGAEIVGIDIAAGIDNATFKEIYDAWLAHQVIVFRDQSLDEEAQIAFGARFGELWTVPEKVRSTAETARPETVMMITNIRDQSGKAVGSLPDGEMFFHTDNIYTERPAKATLLYGIDVPSHGGDTRFSNLYKAYDALPSSIRDKLQGRMAEHRYQYGDTGTGAQTRGSGGGMHHPLVCAHPDTGRRAVVACRLMTTRIVGMDEAESRAILNMIWDTAERPELIYDHKWRKGDLVVWDNRCVLHGRSDFDPGERRLMRRVTTNMELRPAA